MRKFLLVAGLVLASASAQAQASGSRSFATVASSDDPANVVTEQPKPADAAKPAPVQKTERRKPRRDWTEARIIGELHRHGIYW